MTTSKETTWEGREHPLPLFCEILLPLPSIVTSSPQKLLVRLHPDATQQIILCLTCLVRRGYVLESTDQETAAIVDVKSLFNR